MKVHWGFVHTAEISSMEVEKSSRPIIGNICRVRQIRFSNLNDFSVRCLCIFVIFERTRVFHLV